MAAGIAIAVTISAISITTIRIGSSAYDDIIQVKDLVADILPPPLYIVEAISEARGAFLRSEPMADIKKRIDQLHKDYDERRTYWKSANLDSELKDKLTGSSHFHVAKFWNLLEQLLPAIEANNDVAAKKIYQELNESFRAHRLTINEIVVGAETLNKAVEAKAAQQGLVALWSIGAVDGALLLLLMIGIVAIIRRLVTPLGIVGRGLERLSEGDLTAKLTEKVPPEYRQLQDNFNAAVGKLQSIIGSVATSAREVTNASAEIATSTTDLSQRTEEQAASLEETSASMVEISAAVKKNAESAHQANESADATREVADRGGTVVAEAVDAMAKIEESSRKISDIIGVIDEISRQTNLLALNAAVEAARAGDAGRGFAVVASEVRSLAQRSSAAKDIKDLITNSNSQVKDGVDLVNRAGGALTEIMASIKTVFAVVSDIASASAEQASGIDQINKALAQMDEVTQQNSALVEENAAMAKTLEHQAKSMDDQVAFFQIDAAAVDGGRARKSSGPVAAKPGIVTKAAA